MPIGVLLNVAAVVIGGLIGTFAGDRLPERMKEGMNTVFGFCAMAMGISSVMLMKNMPAVIFAVIIGCFAGLWLDLDGRIRHGAEKLLARLNMGGDMNLMVTAIVLFCASGTGIYGSLVSGMEGDHSVLIAKAILDVFTAMIFACQLKKAVVLIAIPQLAVMLLFFFSAGLIVPLTNPNMIADFKACGGVILLATGLTIMKVKNARIANMLPALALVMPVSALWTALFG